VALQTKYEFVLPRGYVDAQGALHREGVMRLATARDELDPLRDPTIAGPDDPRLTVLVLARVVERLGTLELVTAHEIEGLFAADLAFLQDFYGVINFGNQEEYEALLAAQQQAPPPTTPVAPAISASASAGDPPAEAAAASNGHPKPEPSLAERPSRRAAIEEIPAGR
jgi:hypothetical protein